MCNGLYPNAYPKDLSRKSTNQKSASGLTNLDQAIYSKKNIPEKYSNNIQNYTLEGIP